MTNRDDMVITPSLEGEERAARPVAARDQRPIARARRNRSRFIRRAAMARTARRIAARRGLARKTRSKPKLAGGGFGMGKLARGGMWTLGILAGIQAARTATGRSLEGMGAAMKGAVIGDMPEEALAARGAMEMIATHPQFQAVMNEHGMTDGIQRVYRTLKQHLYQEAHGAAVIMRDADFDVPSDLEVILDRLAEGVTKIRGMVEGR